MVMVTLGGGVWDANGEEAGAAGGLEPGVRILEGDRVAGTQAELVDGMPVDVGLRLGIGDIATAGKEIELGVQTQPLQVALDPGVIGVAGDGQLKPRSLAGLEQLDNPRKHRLLQGPCATDDATLVFQAHLVGDRPEGGPRIEAVVSVPDLRHKTSHIKGKPMPCMHLRIRLNNGRLGIHDKAVKIENKCSQHGKGFIACYGTKSRNDKIRARIGRPPFRLAPAAA